MAAKAGRKAGAAARPAARKRGRPARLSREAIVGHVLELLQVHSAEELSLAAIAESLGTATMSLYNYFDNRDALLDAVVDQALSGLAFPPLGPDWQQDLLAWLWALQRHFERYPVILKTMGWNGRVPAGWMHVAAPLVQRLRLLGLSGRELAFAFNWFMSCVIGQMMVESVAQSYRRSTSLEGIDKLPPQEQQAIFELQTHRQQVERDRVLEFGFRQAIRGLEALLPPPRKGANRN